MFKEFMLCWEEMELGGLMMSEKEISRFYSGELYGANAQLQILA